MKGIRKEVFIALLCAFAVIVNLFEGAYLSFLPYGLKIGLANIFALIAWKKYGRKEMLLLNFLRVTVAALLKGSLFSLSFFIALGGIALSSLMLLIMNKKAGLMFVSLLCAIMHNIGQLFVVVLIYQDISIAVMLPALLLLGIPCGIFTGFTADLILKRIEGYFI
ncbi:MAG: Gx transporter family protein [Erysipelotrichaceae bacterium]|nr:Gx transporter family protein [Erysipelotrichaceae bacterium]